MRELLGGEEVFVKDTYGTVYLPGRVTKVTPKGFVDVLIGDSACPVRFRPDGRESGATPFRCRHLDDLSFTEREANNAALKRIEYAAHLLNAVRLKETVRGTWSKESLLSLVNELEARVHDARTATEAI